MLKTVGIKLQGSEQNLAKAGEMMKNAEPTATNSPLPLAPQLYPQHPLLQLAQAIDWSSFDSDFSKLSQAEVGRPPLPIRLLVGLHYSRGYFKVGHWRCILALAELEGPGGAVLKTVLPTSNCFGS